MSVVTSWQGRRLVGRALADVLPHDVEYGGAYETVLYGAGKEKGAGVLHERAHDVGAPALVQMVRAFESPRDSVVFAALMVGVGVFSVTAQVYVTGFVA